MHFEWCMERLKSTLKIQVVSLKAKPIYYGMWSQKSYVSVHIHGRKWEKKLRGHLYCRKCLSFFCLPSFWGHCLEDSPWGESPPSQGKTWPVPLVPGDACPGQVLEAGLRDTEWGRVRNPSGWKGQPGLSLVPRTSGCSVGPALAGYHGGRQCSHPTDPGLSLGLWSWWRVASPVPHLAGQFPRFPLATVGSPIQ